MALLENLTEEEAYLLSILSDRSGIDQAELLWKEETDKDTGAFRARSYQVGWWRDESQFQVDLSCRSVGKSLGITVKAFAHIFVNPGYEMVITAPELIHLEPLTSLVEYRLMSTRLSREMFGNGRGTFSHRPFACKALNGAQIYGRIPQRDGRGLKGVHPLWLETDESQDFPDKGYYEVIETLRHVPGSQWRCHGVTNGVGGWFYNITKGGGGTSPLRETPKQTQEDWTIHRLVAMVREDWTDTERQEKIVKYGSRESPDYLRNVLGMHGPAQNVIFVLHRLVKCADDDISSSYNQDEYFTAEIRDSDLQRPGSNVLDFLDFPENLRKYKTIYIGEDVGYVNDPSEILVFAEVQLTATDRKIATAAKKALPAEGQSRLKLISRISLHRVPEPVQVEVMMHVIDFFRPVAYALDKTGNGLPLFQNVQQRLQDVVDTSRSQRAREALDAIKGYGFSEKILVDFDESIDVGDRTIDEQIREAGIKRMVLEVSTDHLRSLVDNERLWLPWDTDLIRQFSGQTFAYSRVTQDAYGRRRLFSQGDFHALDAARMAALAHKQHGMDSLLASRETRQAPILDAFMAEYR